MANHFRARPRMLIAVALGLAAGSLLGTAIPSMSTVTRALIGWNVGVWLYLVLIAASMHRSDHGRMRQTVLAHAEGAITVSAMVVLASLASFAAIVLELAAGKVAGSPPALPQVMLTLVTVMGSWLLLPTLYTLNYASLYYTVDEGTGLNFPCQDADFQPHYVDFLYFSFTIAVALQTADVAITSKAMRLVVLSQAMLSFVFNTTVLAFMINIASGLF
jgi:uncharacterized membrane protein